MAEPEVELDDEAIACLRRLHTRGGELAPPYPCDLLLQLCSQGLVERVTLNWLPLEMRQFYYRATVEGEALLRQCDAP